MSLQIRRYSTKLRVRPLNVSGTYPSVSRPLRRRDNNFDTWPHSSIVERPAPTPIPNPVGEAETWRAENYKKVVEHFAAKRTKGTLSPPEKCLAWWFGAAERCLREGVLNVREIDEIRKYATFGRQVKIEKVAPRHQSLIKTLEEYATEREEFDKRQVEPSDHARESSTRKILETPETPVTMSEIALKTPEIPSKTPDIPFKTPEIPSVTEVDDASRIARVESIIHYRFHDQSLCLEALTTQLDKHNVATTNNERLALLGGHALSMYVSNLWWESGLPTYFGRSWSAQLEVGSYLGHHGISLGLDKFVLGLHHEYKTPYRVTAEAVQAIIGAVYLDSDRDFNTLKILMGSLGIEKQFHLKVAQAKNHIDLPQRYNANNFESTRPPVKALHDDRPAVEPIVEPSKPKQSAASPITRDVPEELGHQTAVPEPVPAKSSHATRASIISALVLKLSHDELHYHKNWSNQKSVSIEAALGETLKRWRDAMEEIRKFSCELKKNPPPRNVSAWVKILRSFETRLRTYEKQFPTLFANSAELGLLPLEQLREEVEAQKNSTDRESATEDLVEESQRYDKEEFKYAATGGSESQDTSFSSAGTSSGLVDRPNFVPAPGSISKTTMTSEHMLKNPQFAEPERPLPDLGFSYPPTLHTPQTWFNRSDAIEPYVTVSGEADMLAEKANLELTMQRVSDPKTGCGRELENSEDGSVTHPLLSRDSTERPNQTKVRKVEDEESDEIVENRVYIEDVASVFRDDLPAQSFEADDDSRTGKPKAEGKFSWENY